MDNSGTGIYVLLLVGGLLVHDNYVFKNLISKDNLSLKKKERNKESNLD
jgi:hypothetical protein